MTLAESNPAHASSHVRIRPLAFKTAAPPLHFAASHRPPSAPSGWGFIASKEVKVDQSLCPLGTGRMCKLVSEEPFRDSIRPMRASKVLTETMHEARKGGVFRTLKSKGSLSVRRYYKRKQSPRQAASHDEFGHASFPIIEANEGDDFFNLDQSFDESDPDIW